MTLEVAASALVDLVRELAGAERENVWAEVVSVAPGAGEYQNQTTRTIPVLLLTRIS